MDDDVVYLYTDSVNDAGKLIARSQLPAGAVKASIMHWYSQPGSAEQGGPISEPVAIDVFVAKQ